ncbi:hypothetical protein T492DRAFT_11146 [Pavlovales sp. CCMP2436]|nr:hypothetical protein T492DRAFT_11146 [Pavlovales sp. CCMP2436]
MADALPLALLPREDLRALVRWLRAEHVCASSTSLRAPSILCVLCDPGRGRETLLETLREQAALLLLIFAAGVALLCAQLGARLQGNDKPDTAVVAFTTCCVAFSFVGARVVLAFAGRIRSLQPAQVLRLLLDCPFSVSTGASFVTLASALLLGRLALCVLVCASADYDQTPVDTRAACRAHALYIHRSAFSTPASAATVIAANTVLPPLPSLPCAVAACAIAAIVCVLVERRLGRAPARAAGLEIVRTLAEAEMRTRNSRSVLASGADSEGPPLSPHDMGAEFELYDDSSDTEPSSHFPVRKLTSWRSKGSLPVVSPRAVSPRQRTPGQPQSASKPVVSVSKHWAHVRRMTMSSAALSARYAAARPHMSVD